MKTASGTIAPLVQAFFADHLVRQRRASPQTVASYRDTFRLLIQHLSQITGRKPSNLTLDDLNAKAILQFLDSLEKDRGNSIQTRNARLAAIRSFFRLVTLREPDRIWEENAVRAHMFLDPGLERTRCFGPHWNTSFFAPLALEMNQRRFADVVRQHHSA